MILYISDTHFGHRNIINHDHRPFADSDEMDRAMIKFWNGRVSNDDDVYIVGDLIYRSSKDPVWYLRQLKGRKHLITGNHDGVIINDPKAVKYFVDINQILTVTDGDKRIVLCHYPLAEWDGYFHDAWHVYGHIHNNTNTSYSFMKTQGKALNAAACINNYTPASFNELVTNNTVFKESH